ncbi:MAG: hypothetical protein PVI57_21815 [Gemmatimonadota bacterium]|jgi:hypothetical protein
MRNGWRRPPFPRGALLALVAAVAYACGSPPDDRAASDGPPDAPEASSPGDAVPGTAAVAALAGFDTWCGRGADLWGRELCGPLVLVDSGTRRALANARPPDPTFTTVAGEPGRWTGTLADSISLANTAFQWGDQRWSMVLLPLPEDAYDRTALLAHESFHRIQPSLDLEAPTPVPPHLQERTGRLWLRLEIRALAEALRSSGDAALRAARDAALFRRARHDAHPGADTLEADLEIHEGLAAYTGSRVARDVLDVDDARVAEEVARQGDRDSYGRSFAYATGPALGILLDRWAPGWRDDVGRDAPLHGLFEGAVAPVSGDAVDRARGYGYEEIAAEEEARERRMLARLDTLRRRFVEPPVLRIRSEDTRGSFDPTAIVTLGEHGTVYFRATFQGAWGVLEGQESGVLVAPDWATLAVPGPVRDVDGGWAGPGWTLEPSEGWTVEGPEEGVWRIVPPPAGDAGSAPAFEEFR